MVVVAVENTSKPFGMIRDSRILPSMSSLDSQRELAAKLGGGSDRRAEAQGNQDETGARGRARR